MRCKKLLLLFFFFLTTQIYSQNDSLVVRKILKGQVIDSETKKALSASHILNLNSVSGTITDDKGFFEITAKTNDTVMVSYLGHSSIKIKVTNDLLKGNELLIALYEKSEEVKEIIIRSSKLIGVLEVDVKQVPKDKFARIHINGMPQTYEVGKASPKSMTSVGAAIYHPIDFMYNMFGKKPKALRKLKKLKQQENLRNILGSKFNREVMQEYLQMTTKQLNELLEDCNYSAYFIKTASDLQVVEAILSCHENYKALQKGSVQHH